MGNAATESNCIICGNPLTQRPRWPPDTVRKISSYACFLCGDYRVSWKDQAFIPGELGGDNSRRVTASHHVRRLARSTAGEPPPLITVEIVRRMLEEGLPDPAEQAANLLLWIGDCTHNGEWMDVKPEADFPRIGSHDGEAMRWVMAHLTSERLAVLEEKGRAVDVLVRGERTARYEVLSCMLTMRGWDRYGELKRGATDSRLAFMAMEFDNPLLEAVYKDVLKPAVAATGFELRRIDEKPSAGSSIDDQIRVAIRRSRFAVVDLTNDNSGAYWEAGYAEGLGRRVFFTCLEAEDQKPHFDTRQQPIVFWTPDNLDELGKRLKNIIRATLPDAKLED
jgi:hypothetical protein